MILQYKVTGQTLRPAGIMPTVVSDSVDFIHLEFSLDNWWQGMVVVAQFCQEEQTLHQSLDETGACLLPDEFTSGTVELMLFGQIPGETTRATTNSIPLHISHSHFINDGESPIPPTPDLYSQLLETFASTIQGDPGQDGQDGISGVDGTDGASAYEIAVENGFSGTESEWLLSLKGTDGVDGADGQDGATGATGATGAQGEKGDIGDSGADGATGPQGEKGDTGDAGADGQDGATGATGADGQDGADGADGLTTSVTLNGTTYTQDNGNIDLGDIGGSVFDVVIRTQGEFDALIASDTWLDAMSVCFVGDGGSMTFTRSDGSGCLIPATVKCIQGLNTPIIEVTNFVYNSTTNMACLYYDTLPDSDAGYWIDGISVVAVGANTVYAFRNCTNLTNCTGSGTAIVSDSTVATGYGAGFYSCTILTNCTGTGSGTGAGASSYSGWGYGYGFRNCTTLTNCTGTGYGTGSSTGNSYAYGFYACTTLTNCTGSGYATTNSAAKGYYAYGFFNCTNLINCTGTGTATSSGSTSAYAYGFYLCTNLTNCTGSGIAARTSTGTSTSCGFDNCTNLTNCTGTGSGTGITIGYAYGFRDCSYLSNCTGTGTSSNTDSSTSVGVNMISGCGFQDCSYLSNCTGTGTSSNTDIDSGYFYGFYDCSYLSTCSGSGIISFLGGTNTCVDSETVEEG